MPKAFNASRRKYLKLGLFGAIASWVLHRFGYADDLLSLLDNKQPAGINNLINTIESTHVSVGNPNLNHIIAIRIWPSDVYTRITVEAMKPIESSIYQDSSSLVIGLNNFYNNLTILDSAYNNLIKHDSIIENIAIVKDGTCRVKIKFNLKTPVRLQTSMLDPVHFELMDYHFRYIVDLYKINPNPSINPTDDLLLLLQSQNSLVPKPIKNSNLASNDALLTLSKSIESANMLKRNIRNNIVNAVSGGVLNINKPYHNDVIKVMIDPGHGGEDPGAIGHMGTMEKHIVLDIGKHLYDLINAEDNMRAYFTRSQDIFVPLAIRVLMARRARADIFISIHADAFTREGASGASVFMLSNRGASSAFASFLARTQNASDAIGGVSFKVRDRATKMALLDMSQSWTIEQSAKLGRIVLNKMSNIGSLHNPRVERAAFAVLKAPDIPSVLVESAFISNLQNEQQLNDPQFRYNVATALLSGVKEYFA